MKSEIVAGRTVFEIAEKTEKSFSKVAIDYGIILPLVPVHYKYINTAREPPRKYAINGELPLNGKRIKLMG